MSVDRNNNRKIMSSKIVIYRDKGMQQNKTMATSLSIQGQ